LFFKKQPIILGNIVQEKNKKKVFWHFFYFFCLSVFWFVANWLAMSNSSINVFIYSKCSVSYMILIEIASIKIKINLKKNFEGTFQR